MGEILPYEIWYENSKGDVIRFDTAPIVVQTTGLFDWQWSISAYDRAIRDGGRAVAARRPVQDRTLVLDVFADTQADHNAAIDRLHNVLEYDLCTLTPGKLWIEISFDSGDLDLPLGDKVGLRDRTLDLSDVRIITSKLLTVSADGVSLRYTVK